MKQVKNGLDVIDVIQPAFCLITMFMWLFLFCFLGEMVTSRFRNVDDALYECVWYLYPMEIRKKFPIMILISQEPVSLRGFANFRCTHEAFNKV